MTGALEDLECTVSTGSRTITKFSFDNDIGGLAGEQEEPENFAESLDKAYAAYGMDLEISAEKTKSMTNNTSDFNTDESKCIKA